MVLSREDLAARKLHGIALYSGTVSHRAQLNNNFCDTPKRSLCDFLGVLLDAISQVVVMVVPMRSRPTSTIATTRFPQFDL